MIYTARGKFSTSREVINIARSRGALAFCRDFVAITRRWVKGALAILAGAGKEEGGARSVHGSMLAEVLRRWFGELNLAERARKE